MKLRFPFLATHGCTLSLVLFFFAGMAFAQDIPEKELEPVLIEASRLPIAWMEQPIQVSLIDSAMAASSGARHLGEVLAFGSPLFIRSYGGSGVNSVTSRGFGPRQVQLVWNGFAVNHPMLGQNDYALFPAQMLSNIRVASGNGSAGFGSGAVAGSVLADSPESANRTAFGFQQGAWGNAASSFSTGAVGDNWNIGIAYVAAQAENNYPYFDAIRQRPGKRLNNRYENSHLLLNGGISLRNLSYKTALWLGETEHYISGPVTTRNPSAVQNDNFVRWSNRLQYAGGAGLYQVDGFYSRYKLDYNDPRARIDSQSEVVDRQFRLGYLGVFWDNLNLAAGSETAFTNVKTNNYVGSVSRTRQSLYLQTEYRPLDFLLLFPSARYDHYSDFGGAFTGAMGINVVTPLSWLRLRGQASSNFNAPTMNDLHWRPGGNPELMPERSISLEAGLSAEWKSEHIGFRWGLTMYDNRFRNGIRWMPGQGGIWSPENIARIRSRGMESDAMFRAGWNGLEFRATASLARTKITPDDGESPKLQMPYAPEWLWKGTAMLAWKPVFVTLSREFAGERFTTDDHSSPLDPLGSYSVYTLQGGLRLRFARFGSTFSYTLYNLTDTEYQVIAWYPMPPRHHRLSINISIQH